MENQSSDVVWTADKVRNTFIDFFVEKCGHQFVPSSCVVPHDDPTLQFCNAGMNQFKPIFLGTVDPNSSFGKLKRAVNSQKCIRAGGKHNDLDDVGKDVYHHTFFEMLGNWSFGDFFKKEIIEWAFELLTKVYGLDEKRLYASYFSGDASLGLEPDHEARDIWLQFLPEDRVLPFDAKDNFWEMGKTGPCGPCSEIHYDRIGERDAAALVNMDDPDVLEIWNLVFIQYNRQEDGTVKALPAKHVDTGLGMERVVSILQNKTSNYDTGIFQPLFESIQKLSGCRPYTGKIMEEDVDGVDTAYRVVADHARTVCIAIADGALPSNINRGYVVRRIIRRATRFINDKLFAHMGEDAVNNANAADLLTGLIPKVVELLGGHYPELASKQNLILELVAEEVKAFLKTMKKGCKKFKSIVSKLKDNKLPASEMLIMYGSYGYPLDLVKLMAEEHGLVWSEDELAACIAQSKEDSKGAAKGDGVALTLDQFAIKELTDKNVPITNDDEKYNYEKNASNKYQFQPLTGASVLAIKKKDGFVDSVSCDDEELCGLILDKTNFYAENGGQIYDTGFITLDSDNDFCVENVQVHAGYVMHIGKFQSASTSVGSYKIGSQVTCSIDEDRRVNIMCNHTATHILNFGIRECIDKDSNQKGSGVFDKKLRFDYSYNEKGGLSEEQLEKLNNMINSVIDQGLNVFKTPVPKDDAIKIAGLRAMGANYPDVVRVVSVGSDVEQMVRDAQNNKWYDYAVEFCGGTHVINSADIKRFCVISDNNVMSGVRRMIAVTGDEAMDAFDNASVIDKKVTELENVTDLSLLAKPVLSIMKELETLSTPALERMQLRKRLDSLRKTFDDYEKKIKAAQMKEAVALVKQTIQDNKDAPYYCITLNVGSNAKAMDAAVKELKKSAKNSIFLIFSHDQEKVICKVAVPKDKVTETVSARKWCEAIADVIGGKGNGSDMVGMASGTSVDKFDQSVALAKEFLLEL